MSTKKVQKIKVNLEPFREGEEVSEDVPPGDFTSGDDPLAGGDTAYPIYIDKKGNVKHGGPRTTVEEKVTPNVDSVSTDDIHLRIKKAKGSKS